MLILTKPNQKPDQQNLDQPVIKVCGRKPRPEKQSLYEEVQQLIAATPGYEDSSAEELALIADGLLEFASIAYSIFKKENHVEGAEDESENGSLAGGPVKSNQAHAKTISKSNLVSTL